MTIFNRQFGPINLQKASVLLSNDDGINAQGLKSLELILRPIVKELIIVAPESEQSATSHSLTLRRPLRINQLSEEHFSVDGTPTDAVLLGVTEISKGRQIDLIISGINRGGNIGEDVTYSGTVAAAMEGTLLGVPSIALSQIYTDNHRVKWSTAEDWAPKILQKVLSIKWPSSVLMNINFPDIESSKVTGVEICVHGHRKINSELQRGRDPRGDEYFWIGMQKYDSDSTPGTDLEATARGAIAITPLSLEMTHTQTLNKMKSIFDE